MNLRIYPLSKEILKNYWEVRNLIKDNIFLATEDKKGIDKVQLAIAIRNSTYGVKLRCSLLEDGVVNGCDGCNLKFICEGLEDVAQDYLECTTKIINSFSFQ